MTSFANLTLRTEAFGPRPEFEHPRRSRRRALRTERKSGHSIRRTVNERQLRGYELAWDGAPEGVAVFLRNAWQLASGPVLPLAYTPVGLTDAEALDVCFVGDTLDISQIGPGRYQIRVEVEEVL